LLRAFGADAAGDKDENEQIVRVMRLIKILMDVCGWERGGPGAVT
jgi:hypothetical protein